MNKLSIQNSKQISMFEIMEKLGFTHQKEKGNSRWYHSPFRNESTPSFKVNAAINMYYDFGTSQYGDNIDLVRRVMRVTTSEALQYLSNMQPYSFSFGRSYSDNLKSIQQSYTTTLISSNATLMDYMSSKRGISTPLIEQYCSMVTIDNKYSYVGFKNDNHGYALRNQYHKRAIAPVGITSQLTNNSTIKIFEGFIDFLSYLELEGIFNICKAYDVIVLNSISNISKALSCLANYRKVDCYLDNDKAGIETYNQIAQVHSYTINHTKYLNPKQDLNQFLLESTGVEKRIFKENHF